MAKIPELYTQEVIVFRSRVNNANLTSPITVYADAGGHHALAHGNHRAYRSFETGQDVEREIIGTIPKDVSQDPYYRPISKLKVIDK